MAKVILDSKEFIVTQSKFKTWIELEEIREKIFHAIEIEDTDDIGTHILFYVSTALNIDVSTINNLPWKEVLSAYSIIVAENLNIRLLPFMKYSKKKLDDEREIWDYPGRLWYSYSHKIANEYGWKLSDISDLEVDDAFSLVQEILVSDQINKEWEWTLSEKSVGYDEASKKSRFIELPRPDWMKPIPKPPQKVKMPRVMMPQGNILKLTTDGRLENVVY